MYRYVIYEYIERFSFKIYMQIKKIFLIFFISFTGNLNLCSENILNDNGTTEKISDHSIVKIHVVKKGETLSSISKLYGINKETLLKINKLKSENLIYVGQNLQLINKSINMNSSSNFIESGYHKIKVGENLTDIANQYDLNIQNLIELNNIENVDSISAGTLLKLKPVPKKKDQYIEKIKFLKENEYGPISIISGEKFLKNGRKILYAINRNGQKIILSINCKKQEIDVRSKGRDWKGWMPASKKFEINLLDDFCKKL